MVTLLLLRNIAFNILFCYPDRNFDWLIKAIVQHSDKANQSLYFHLIMLRNIPVN